MEQYILIYPHVKSYLNADGSMYAELGKYLYGLQEAPFEFNQLLTFELLGMGFVQSRSDKCLFYKKTSQGIILICTHVDDILIASPTKELQQLIEAQLKQKFDISSQYDNLSYLGLNITKDTDKNTIRVNQQGYIDNLLNKYNMKPIKKFPSTPAALDLMEEASEEETKLNEEDKKRYKSIIMALMYLGRFTRSDILLPVSYLATKSAEPTDRNMQQLYRILRYLQGTRNVGINIHNPTMELQAFVDASHISHPDGHGHGGLILSLGSSPIYSRSWKLKSVTRSSSETELIALEDSVTFVIWTRELLREIGQLEKEPTTIFQDNKSTIILAMQGGNFKRTKHLLCKESYVREKLNNNEITLRYLPTINMLADYLTKPVPRQVLNHLTKLAKVISN